MYLNIIYNLFVYNHIITNLSILILLLIGLNLDIKKATLKAAFH